VVESPGSWGPLAALIGTWEGAEGVDVSYAHGPDASRESRFRERVAFEPFGPVENGAQVLYGLDYRMTAHRLGEDEPFHMEVGYWLWDADAGQVMRCFMVPRGTTVMAIGSADADAREFTLEAESGRSTNGILSNPYLDRAARTTRYRVDVSIGADGAWAYDELTELAMAGQPEPYAHTDRNRLRRVG